MIKNIPKLGYTLSMSIKTLFIDLDGTLYPNENGMWDAIAERMEKFMHQILHLPLEIIPALRQNYFVEYGTTLKGLQENYSIDQFEYLEYVHDIPLAQFLKPDTDLRKILQNIPHTKWIFTNADQAHSERVLSMLGIQDLFDGIIDVVALDFLNKPNPLVYSKALEIAGVSIPSESIFFDDTPRNLSPAKRLGMKTVLVGNKPHNQEVDIQIQTIYSITHAIETLNGSGTHV